MEDPWLEMKQARGALRSASRLAGQPRSEVINLGHRRRVVEALGGDDLAQNRYSMRQERTRDRWRGLLDLGIAKPVTLGFIRVEHGLRGLADNLDTCASTLSRNLTTWEAMNPPLVAVGRSQRDRGRPEVVLVKIPLLTEWLLWVAEARAEYRCNPWGTIRYQEIRQFITVLASQGLPPPSSPRVSREEARRLLAR